MISPAGRASDPLDDCVYGVAWRRSDLPAAADPPAQSAERAPWLILRDARGITPIRRWGTPEDCGKAVAALATGAFPFSTGDTFEIDGGFHMRIL